MEHVPSRVVHVEIHGQQYAVRSTLDAAYVAELAAHVDSRMRLAVAESPSGDTLKLAVLAAINIADECFRAREEARERASAVVARAGEIEGLLDRVLGHAATAAAAAR